jgi:hypothetical protein
MLHRMRTRRTALVLVGFALVIWGLWSVSRAPARHETAMPASNPRGGTHAGDFEQSGPALSVANEPEVEVVASSRLEFTRFPDSPIAVRVVNGSGRPRAGIEVQLVHDGSSEATAYWSGTTSEPNGEVVLHSLNEVLARVHPVPALAFEVVGLDVECDRESIDPARPPSGPIVLTLGEGGAIEVVVVSEGRPLDGVSVSIGITPALNSRRTRRRHGENASTYRSSLQV